MTISSFFFTHYLSFYFTAESATKKEPKTVTKSVPVNSSQKRKLESPTVGKYSHLFSFHLPRYLILLCFSVSKKIAKEPPKKALPSVLNNDNIEECEDLGYVVIDTAKKTSLTQKLEKLKTVSVHKKEEKSAPQLEDMFNMSEDDDDDDDNVEVIINDPIVTPFGGYKRYPAPEKYDVPFAKSNPKLANSQLDSKRTVFKRLGEDISQHSVTSTTAFEDEDQTVSKKIQRCCQTIARECKIDDAVGSSVPNDFENNSLLVLKIRYFIFQNQFYKFFPGASIEAGKLVF